MRSFAPSRNWRLRFLSVGFIREGLILCPLVTLFQWPWLSSVNLNENIQAGYAQSQPWLTHCFHFYLEALFYVYQALTVSAHWCWFTDASFIYSFIHSFGIIYSFGTEYGNRLGGGDMNNTWFLCLRQKETSLQNHGYLISLLIHCVNHNNCGKFLKKWNTRPPDCLLRNLYADQEATVRTGHGTTDWFQMGKGVCQGCLLSPCLFNLYAEHIMWNARLNEAQAGIKIGRNTNNLRYADNTTLWQKAKKN